MKENSFVLYSIRSSAILLRWVKHNEAQNKNSAKKTYTHTHANMKRLKPREHFKIKVIFNVFSSFVTIYVADWVYNLHFIEFTYQQSPFGLWRPCCLDWCPQSPALQIQMRRNYIISVFKKVHKQTRHRWKIAATKMLSNMWQDNNNLVILSLTFPQQLPVDGKWRPSHGTTVNNKNHS